LTIHFLLTYGPGRQTSLCRHEHVPHVVGQARSQGRAEFHKFMRGKIVFYYEKNENPSVMGHDRPSALAMIVVHWDITVDP